MGDGYPEEKDVGLFNADINNTHPKNIVPTIVAALKRLMRRDRYAGATNFIPSIAVSFEQVKDPLGTSRVAVYRGNILFGTTQSPHPVGYVYVQYPGKKSPVELGLAGAWKNISTNFAGSFLRLVPEAGFSLPTAQAPDTISGKSLSVEWCGSHTHTVTVPEHDHSQTGEATTISEYTRFTGASVYTIMGYPWDMVAKTINFRRALLNNHAKTPVLAPVSIGSDFRRYATYPGAMRIPYRYRLEKGANLVFTKRYYPFSYKPMFKKSHPLYAYTQYPDILDELGESPAEAGNVEWRDGAHWRVNTTWARYPVAYGIFCVDDLDVRPAGGAVDLVTAYLVRQNPARSPVGGQVTPYSRVTVYVPPHTHQVYNAQGTISLTNDTTEGVGGRAITNPPSHTHKASSTEPTGPFTPRNQTIRVWKKVSA